MFLQVRHLTGFRSFLRRHDRISKFSNGALESLSDTKPREIGLRKRGRPYDVPIIFTLDPNKFAEKNQQRLRLGSLRSMGPRLSLHNQSQTVAIPRTDYNQIFQITSKGVRTTERQPFPPGTNAFLYYFIPPDKPRIAGELRLRVTSSDDPASFESGSDLLRPNGQPWLRPLYMFPKYYPTLYEKLREDGFVPDDLDRALSTLSPQGPRYIRFSERLYSLNDTFTVDFSRKKLHFVAITEKGTEKMPFYYAFWDGRNMWMRSPYTGIALSRFERSTLPEHKGTRTIVLRFLKIITPVKCVLPLYDGRIGCPKEGELHKSGRRKLWSVNIDKSNSAGPSLQLLWDT